MLKRISVCSVCIILMATILMTACRNSAAAEKKEYAVRDLVYSIGSDYDVTNVDQANGSFLIKKDGETVLEVRQSDPFASDAPWLYTVEESKFVTESERTTMNGLETRYYKYTNPSETGYNSIGWIEKISDSTYITFSHTVTEGDKWNKKKLEKIVAGITISTGETKEEGAA